MIISIPTQVNAVFVAAEFQDVMKNDFATLVVKTKKNLHHSRVLWT